MPKSTGRVSARTLNLHAAHRSAVSGRAGLDSSFATENAILSPDENGKGFEMVAAPLCHRLNGRSSIRLSVQSAKRPDILEEPSPVEQLIARLLVRAFKGFPEPYFKRPIVRAAREAVLLAESTGFALLVLPELFAELAIAAMARAEYLRRGRF